MVGGLSALLVVEVAAVFIAADLLSSQSSKATNNCQTNSGGGKSADSSITMELLMMAAMRTIDISAIKESSGKRSSGSAECIGVVVVRTGLAGWV